MNIGKFRMMLMVLTIGCVVMSFFGPEITVHLKDGKYFLDAVPVWFLHGFRAMAAGFGIAVLLSFFVRNSDK